MNMEFNTRTRARLYALTCLACLAWLVQTVVQSYGDGTLLTWPTAILALCLIVVVGYRVQRGGRVERRRRGRRWRR